MVCGKTAEELLMQLKLHPENWKNEVDLFSAILEVKGTIQDKDLFVASIQELTKRIYNLRSAYVSEILRFFKEIIIFLK